MQITREVPRILETWLEFINAYERAVTEIDDAVPGPSLQMLGAFAGAFVAGLSGGVSDPGSFGTRVALPDGGCALIAVASDDRGDDFGMMIDPERIVADWVVLVVFKTLRPVAVHVVDSRQLAGLSRVLRVQGPLPPNAPPSAMLLSTAFHWNLCLEPLAAEAFGVRTYYLSAGGMSREPHPVLLPPVGERITEEVPR